MCVGEPGRLVGSAQCCSNDHVPEPPTPDLPTATRRSPAPSPGGAIMTLHIPLPSAWRREALRTNLWLVPTVEIALAVVLFAGTYAVDRAAYNGTLHFPSFLISGTADAAREILTTIAAAVIRTATN